MSAPKPLTVRVASGRLLPATGLVLAAALALWWLGSSRLALQQGADAGRAAAAVLAGAWLLRAMALALLAPSAGQACGLRAAWAAATGLLAPCWPLVVLAWSAGPASALATGLAEVALLAAAAVLCGLGVGAGRRWPSHWALPGVLQALGVLGVAALWAGRAALTAWAGWA